MARWQDVVASQPDLAAEVRAIFEAHKHKTIATLRRDGSPRLSGLEFEVTDPKERARFTDDPPGAYPLFVLDIDRVVRVKLDGSPPHLLIQTWRPGQPLESAFAD